MDLSGAIRLAFVTIMTSTNSLVTFPNHLSFYLLLDWICLQRVSNSHFCYSMFLIISALRIGLLYFWVRPNEQRSVRKVMASVFYASWHNIHHLPADVKNSHRRVLYSVIGQTEQRNREKRPHMVKKKSSISSRQCAVIHVLEIYSQIGQIMILSSCPSSVFSRLDPRELLSVSTPQAVPPEKKIWIERGVFWTMLRNKYNFAPFISRCPILHTSTFVRQN